MEDCCQNKACEIEALRKSQSSVLKIVLFINAAMFLIEITAGILADSTALLADSLDMLGDALVYGFSLYVIARGAKWKAIASLAKGWVMAIFGLFVMGQAFYKMLFPHLPVFETIGVIGGLALSANSLCLILLWRHRRDDINMRSVWICSRNDIIANTSVLVAALCVWLTESGWPDILIGLALSGLFLRSAFYVLKEGRMALKKNGNDDSHSLDYNEPL